MVLRQNLVCCSEAKLLDKTPRLAEEVTSLAMDSRDKPHNRINAMALLFQTVATHLIDQSPQLRLAELKLQLDKSEYGGPVLDV